MEGEMVVQCVMCPDGECFPECPTLDVLPFGGPSIEDNIRKGQKLIAASGMNIEDIKEKLKDAGSVEAKNELINKWIEDYDSREKGELYHLIRNMIIINNQQRLLDDQAELIAERKDLLQSYRDLIKEAKAYVEKATSNPVVVADEGGLLGLKKRLDGPSSPPKD